MMTDRRWLTAILAIVFALPAAAQSPSPATLSRWRREAAGVTITRDRYGIAHVYGQNDADAVFGMEYAQAE
ncbi:MAG: penicillin acylase family protein, partial [Terriglobales bacterium]